MDSAANTDAHAEEQTDDAGHSWYRLRTQMLNSNGKRPRPYDPTLPYSQRLAVLCQ